MFETSVTLFYQIKVLLSKSIVMAALVSLDCYNRIHCMGWLTQ